VTDYLHTYNLVIDPEQGTQLPTDPGPKR